jgi:putative phage-type endonuclease
MVIRHILLYYHYRHMNYSVKRFVKKWGDRTYTPQEFEILANDMSVDSNNRYTQKSALKVLARFAKADGQVISIDSTDRLYNRKYETIVKNLDVISESESEDGTNYDLSDSDGGDFSNSDDSGDLSETDEVAQDDSEGEVAQEDSEGEINYDLSESDSEESEIEPVSKKTTKKTTVKKTAKKATAKKATAKKATAKKVTKSKSKSRSGSKNVKKRVPFPERPKNAQIAGKEIIKINEPEPSENYGKNSKRKKKVVERIDPNVSLKDANQVDNPSRKVNLFTKKRLNSPALVAAKGSSKSAPKTKRVIKEKKVQKNDHDESDSQSEDESEYENQYVYPIDDDNFKGLFRDDPFYGPYGTDNYHDDDQADDKLAKAIKRRLKVFQYLDAIEYPAQRSKEWFDLRNKVASASDGGTVVGLNPYEKQFDFIVKKVHGRAFQTNIDCYHGKKYEEVATMAYEYRMNVKVKEFGLCRHPVHRILGASPDGIVCEYKLRNDFDDDWRRVVARFDKIRDQLIEEQARIDGDPNEMTPKQKDKFYQKVMIKFNEKKEQWMDPKCKRTKYVGRMLEIKCPFRRKILMDLDAPEVYGAHGEPIKDLKKDSKRGVCPSYYWVQVQLQLECCDLDECDFWQTEIWEYEDAEDFVEDTDPEHPWLSATSKQEKGALIQIMPHDKLYDDSRPYLNRIWDCAEFIYQPRVDMTPQEVDLWLLETIKNLRWTHKGYVFDSVKYYKIIQARNITINRDKKWFKDNLPKFEEIWAYVEFFRENEDKSNILKKYLKTFKTDYYGKTKENYDGEVMEMVRTVCNEPDENSPDKEHRAYARYIRKIEEIIEDHGIEDDPVPSIAEVEDDMQEIKEALDYDSDEELEPKERLTMRKDHIEFVKKMKKLVDSYLFVDVDEDEESEDPFA